MASIQLPRFSWTDPRQRGEFISIRHPAPNPTESLLGYVLRVSEGNGYSSPWSIYCLAGMKSNERRASRVELEKLAKITNWPQEWLDAIAYSAPP